MAGTTGGFNAAQLNEIKKWIEMGFTNGQIAKKMGTYPQKISSARTYLKDHPYV